MKKGRVVLAGGSGFLGTVIARQLVATGYEPVILTRSPDSGSKDILQVPWDGRTVGQWAAFLKGAE